MHQPEPHLRDVRPRTAEEQMAFHDRFSSRVASLLSHSNQHQNAASMNSVNNMGYPVAGARPTSRENWRAFAQHLEALGPPSSMHTMGNYAALSQEGGPHRSSAPAAASARMPDADFLARLDWLVTLPAMPDAADVHRLLEESEFALLTEQGGNAGQRVAPHQQPPATSLGYHAHGPSWGAPAHGVSQPGAKVEWRGVSTDGVGSTSNVQLPQWPNVPPPQPPHNCTVPDDTAARKVRDVEEWQRSYYAWMAYYYHAYWAWFQNVGKSLNSTRVEQERRDSSQTVCAGEDTSPRPPERSPRSPNAATGSRWQLNDSAARPDSEGRGIGGRSPSHYRGGTPVKHRSPRHRTSYTRYFSDSDADIEEELRALSRRHDDSLRTRAAGNRPVKLGSRAARRTTTTSPTQRGAVGRRNRHEGGRRTPTAPRGVWKPPATRGADKAIHSTRRWSPVKTRDGRLRQDPRSASASSSQRSVVQPARAQVDHAPLERDVDTRETRASHRSLSVHSTTSSSLLNAKGESHRDLPWLPPTGDAQMRDKVAVTQRAQCDPPATVPPGPHDTKQSHSAPPQKPIAWLYRYSDEDDDENEDAESEQRSNSQFFASDPCHGARHEPRRKARGTSPSTSTAAPSLSVYERQRLELERAKEKPRWRY